MMKRLSILSTSVLFAAITLLTTGAFAEARELYVSPDGDNTTGSSWEYALHTPNQALEVIKNAPDDTFTVYISEGEYEVEYNDHYQSEYGNESCVYFYERAEFIGGWSSFVNGTPVHDPDEYETIITPALGEYIYNFSQLKTISFNGTDSDKMGNFEVGEMEKCKVTGFSTFANKGDCHQSEIWADQTVMLIYNEGTMSNCLVSHTLTANCYFNFDNSSTLDHCTIYQPHETISSDSIVQNSGVISNTIIWGKGTWDLRNEDGGYATHSCFREADGTNGCLPFDPMFTDVSTADASDWDFSLQNGSPCIDNGLYEGESSLDLFGTERPGGDNKVCMGAIESLDVFEPNVYPDPTLPTVVYVSLSGDNSDGLSWATAMTTLQEGVDVAINNRNQEVWVAAGTYTGDGENVVEIPFNMPLYGGFNGTETIRDQRDYSVNETIIDGENERRGVWNDGILDGFTVQNGTAESGGGVHSRSFQGVYKYNAIVRSCLLKNNASNTGGGVYGGKIYSSIVQGNEAQYHGGGAAVSSAWNCTFKNNVAGEYGGGLAGDAYECLITGNQAKNGGGCNGGRIQKCVISNNTASEYGGGCLIDMAIVDNCLITDNQAKIGGGLAYRRIDNWIPVHMYFYITNCTITKNHALESGGGVSPDNTNYIFRHYVFKNCIIWDNTETSSVSDIIELSYSCAPDGTSETNSISTDPIFVYSEGDDASLWDFHLQSDSPCRMSGTAEDVPELDLEGKLRAVRNGYAAMGAYTGEVTASLVWSD